MDNGKAKGGPKEMMGPGDKMALKQGDWVGKGYHLWRRRSLGEGGPRGMMKARVKMFLRRRWPKENMCPQGWILGREKVGPKNCWGLGRRHPKGKDGPRKKCVPKDE